jgi:protein-tyrosine phosphatase
MINWIKEVVMGKGKRRKLSKLKEKGVSVEKSGVKIWSEMTMEERKELLRETHAKVNKTWPVGGYKTTFVECHTGNKLVFEDPVSGLVFYGGGGSRGAKWYKGMTVIDLADRFKGSVKVEGVSLPRIAAIGSAPRIAIDWSDYKACDFTREEWLVFVEELREARKDGRLPKDVLVCCVGGHGRTGSCLAILASLMGACDKEDPVKFVRSIYCNKAVESAEQLDYIEEVCQVEVKEEPAKNWGKTTYHYGGYTGGGFNEGGGYYSGGIDYGTMKQPIGQGGAKYVNGVIVHEGD